MANCGDILEEITMFKNTKEFLKAMNRDLESDLEPIHKYLENLNHKIDVKIKEAETPTPTTAPETLKQESQEVVDKPSVVATALPQIKETAEAAKSKLKQAGKFAAETGSKTYQATKNSIGRLKDKLFK